MWLSGEEAVAHVRACIWSTSLRRGSTLSYLARAHLLNKLAAGSIRAQGPLTGPTPFAPHVLRSPIVRIPKTFWQNVEWDGRDGFWNRSSLETLQYFEVCDARIRAGWRNPIPMPARLNWTGRRFHK